MDIEIIKKSVHTFGRDSQIAKAVEEMAELIAELARFQNNKGMNINLIEEIADVAIMIEQLKLIFGEDLVDCHIGIKLKRLKGLLNEPGSR